MRTHSDCVRNAPRLSAGLAWYEPQLGILATFSSLLHLHKAVNMLNAQQDLNLHAPVRAVWWCVQVAAAVSEDALYLLFAELEKGLEEPTRRSAAAVVLTNFCANSKLDYQEHVPSLLTVCLHPSNLSPQNPSCSPCVHPFCSSCVCQASVVFHYNSPAPSYDVIPSIMQ